MGLTVFASFIAYITTELDDLLVLFLLCCQAQGKKACAGIVIGKFAGLSLLVVCSTLLGPWLASVPAQEIMGLLGFIPILIGIKICIDLQGRQRGISEGLLFFFLETMVITVANGGDSIAVYTSFFPALPQQELWAACIVFAALQALWCLLALLVINAASVHAYLVQTRQVILPLLFIVLGLYILIADGTILWLLRC